MGTKTNEHHDAERRKKELIFNLLKQNIRTCDPFVAKTLTDCYHAILIRNESELNFLERGIKISIEEQCMDAMDVRSRQADGVVSAFNDLLTRKSKNSLNKEEKGAYERIQDLVYVKISGEEDSYFKTINGYVENLLELNFNQRLPTFNLNSEKKNIFNLFALSLETISEKFQETTISKKSIDALFNLAPSKLFFVTDEDFNIRSLNAAAEKFYNAPIAEIVNTSILELVPELSQFELGLNKEINRNLVKLNPYNSNSTNAELTYLFVENENDELEEKEIGEFIFVFELSDSINLSMENQTFMVNEHLDNLISGLALVKENTDDPMVQDFCASSIHNSYFLRSELHNQLLNTLGSKTDRKNQETIDFNFLLEHIKREVSHLPNVSNVIISIENNKSIPLVADYFKLFSALKNVISNSIAYQDFSKLQCHIGIAISDDNKGTEINLSDNGIGISKNEIDKIFDKGYRCEKKENLNHLGLGLYYTRQNILSLGGHVEVNSAINKGTHFRIFIPNC